MKKLLTVLLAACIVLTALSCAQAQPLEELIVGIVRDEDGNRKARGAGRHPEHG